MKILDQYGNPIEQDVLEEQQTSRLVNLTWSIAQHPGRGLTPSRLNQVLEEAELGNLMSQHDLFLDMEERDADIFSQLSMRKRGVTKLNWDITPPRNASTEEHKLAEYVKELLLDMNDLEALFFDALDGIGHGFSAIEYEWARAGSDWTIQRFHHRPQSWFQLNLLTRTELRLRDGTAEGQILQPFGWLLHVHRATSGYIARSGLGRVLAWPYIFKNYALGDLAEFLDIYGLPVRVGKFPAKSTEAEKATLWRAVAGLGHNAAGIIPASMSIEFQEAAKGSEKPFETMIATCQKMIAKCITGSTLTSEAGGGGLNSNIADIHNEVRNDIRDSDCKQLASSLTRDLIYPLLSINKGISDLRRCPRFVFDVSEAEDLKLYAESLPKLVAIGMKIPAHWAHEQLRIPLPTEQDDILAAPTPPAAPIPAAPVPAVPAQEVITARAQLTPGTPVAALAQSTPGTSPGTTPTQAQTHADQTAIDGALAQLDATLSTQAEKWLKPALAALQLADSADQALELLATKNPLADDALLAEAIARATFVAELIGADAVRRTVTQK